MVVKVMKGKHRAFVFIDVTPGKDKKVAEKLLKYNEVVEVHMITGEHDILAVLEFELYAKQIFTSFQETASKFVLDRIRKLGYVQDTNTIIPSLSLLKVD
jgi:DNA-binding Lrp family transcriptional regulator